MYEVLQHVLRTSDIQYYAYSMKTSNNFQNALPSDFELLHIKILKIFCILSKVSKIPEHKKNAFHPFVFRKKKYIFLHNSEMDFRSTPE